MTPPMPPLLSKTYLVLAALLQGELNECGLAVTASPSSKLYDLSNREVAFKRQDLKRNPHD